MEWEVAVRGKKLTFKQGPYGKRKVIDKAAFETEAEAAEAADAAAFQFVRPYAFGDVWNNLARSLKQLGDGPYTFTLEDGTTTEATVAHQAAADDVGFVVHRAFKLGNGDEVVYLWSFSDLDGLFVLRCSDGAPSVEEMSAATLPHADDGYEGLGRIEKLHRFREHVALETIGIQEWPQNEAWKKLFKRLS
ncbi:hypothetical protein [Enhygromyxa salina]|nr:hypothetical protein [Enhygromyxa salina]